MNPHNQAVSRLQNVLSYSASLVSQLVEAVQSLAGRSARTHARTHTERVETQQLNILKVSLVLPLHAHVCVWGGTKTRLVCRAGVDVKCPTATY